jgi:Protein of unknown function (DUF4058)
MKSPFPGMDPYLESHWGDVHSRLVLYSCDQIQQQLPKGLVARVEERLVVEPEEGDDRSIYPDVRVEEYGPGGRASASGPEANFTEPVVIEYSEPATETFINILEPRGHHRLITVIEFLSPSNKLAGEGRQQYRQMQIELKQSKVTLVEIDLVRVGRRVFSVPAARIPRKLRTTYQACVRRGWRATTWEFYPISLRAALPILRLPLRPHDSDIPLDLQSVIAETYAKGAYGKTINYREPAEPRLSEEDASWAERLLRQAGKR